MNWADGLSGESALVSMVKQFGRGLWRILCALFNLWPFAAGIVTGEAIVWASVTHHKAAEIVLGTFISGLIIVFIWYLGANAAPKPRRGPYPGP